MAVYRVDKLMAEARHLAAEYRRQTGKTLAISGEIALSDAIQLLGLEAADGEQDGYDASRRVEDKLERIQVKARVVFEDQRRAPRIGQLRTDREWDLLLLVLMDENYETVEIWQASRPAVDAALAEANPNRRGSLSVAKLRNIGSLAWSREQSE